MTTKPTEMTYQEWMETIEKECPKVEPTRGGSYCRLPDGSRGYCGYGWCPRRPDLK